MFKKEYSRRLFIKQNSVIGLGTLIGASLPLSLLANSKENERFTDRNLLSFKDKSGKVKPVTNLSEWKMKHEQILEGMQEAMGKLPARSALLPLDMKIVDSLKEDTYTRYTISLTVAENERVSAYLYVPFQLGKPKKLAAMLVLHETGDIGKQLLDGKSPLPNRAQAKELARRGYVVIAPDYPSFGDMKDYDFEHDRYQSGTMKGVFDHMRCVDLLQSRDDVDPERIGVLGHSLGGHNSIFAAAFDPRLKVIISSSGWTLFDHYSVAESTKYYGGRLAPWAQDRYMPLLRDKYQLKGELFPFDFDEVIATLAPRPFFSNSPLNDSNFDVEGVKIGIASVRKVYRFLKAEDNLQVRYPVSGHDFPPDVRMEAYRYIDKILGHDATGKDSF